MSNENNFDAYYTTTLTGWIIILQVSFRLLNVKEICLKKMKET